MFIIFSENRIIKKQSIDIHTVDEINEKALTEYIKISVENNINGNKVEIKPLKDIEIPEEVSDLLSKHSNAKTFFDSLANSYKKEYVQWIISAKREATKEKRKLQMIEKLEAHERLHEKYINCN